MPQNTDQTALETPSNTEETSPVLEAETHSAEAKKGAVDTGRRVDVSNVRPPMQSKTVRRQRQHPQAPRPPREKGDVKSETGQERKTAATALPKKSRRPKNRPEARKEEPKVSEVKPVSHTNGVGHVEIALKPEIAPQWHAPAIRPEPKEWDDSGDFAAMLDAAAPVKKLDIEVGKRVHAKLIYMSKDTAFFALGQKHEGAMSMAELMDANGVPMVKVGDVVDAYVVAIDETIHLSKKVGRFAADLGMLEDAKANRVPVEGKITGINPGGVEVALAGTKAFCPIGQVDVNYVEDAASLVGKTFSFLVTQISNGGRNIVLSRRALLERERGEKARERMATLKVGDRVTGAISRTAEFGAFVDLGGIDGLIPVSELGFGHAAKVEDRVNVGDQVTVEVLRIQPDPKRQGQMRISLSLKAAMPDPFDQYGQYLVAGASLEGKVARLESFGAFIELFPGIDGMIHVSELSEQRVRHPEEILKVGDPVTVRVIDVDFAKRRIALSLRENVERVAKGTLTSSLKRGDRIDGVVERIERYGVFVKLTEGQTALLPASESGQPKGADLGKVFPIGSSLSLMVIDIDDRGRVRASKIAREKSEEQELVRSFTSKQGQSGLGTLGDLLKARGK